MKMAATIRHPDDVVSHLNRQFPDLTSSHKLNAHALLDAPTQYASVLYLSEVGEYSVCIRTFWWGTSKGLSMRHDCLVSCLCPGLQPGFRSMARRLR